MTKPLKGKNIVVTRAREQASGFAKLLSKQGARVLICPSIKIVPPRSWKPLDRAARNLAAYDWLIFTSVNAVEKFADRLMKSSPRGKKFQFPLEVKTCAIGPQTAERMRGFRFPVHNVSKDYVAESILEILKNVRGLKILIPRAAVARDILPKTLKKRGAAVDVVEAYRTVIDASAASVLRRNIKKNAVDCVTFTSSSTVRNFFSLLKGAPREALLGNARVLAASIGPVTTATLLEYGWKPRIAARKPTTNHLARAIAQYYAKEQI